MGLHIPFGHKADKVPGCSCGHRSRQSLPLNGQRISVFIVCFPVITGADIHPWSGITCDKPSCWWQGFGDFEHRIKSSFSLLRDWVVPFPYIKGRTTFYLYIRSYWGFKWPSGVQSQAWIYDMKLLGGFNTVPLKGFDSGSIQWHLSSLSPFSYPLKKRNFLVDGTSLKSL